MKLLLVYLGASQICVLAWFMHFIAILNPAANSGRSGRNRHRIKEAFQSAGMSFELWLTEFPGHAIELAKKAAGVADVVVAVGGDGTIHEVGKGLVEGCDTAIFAAIPCGTGNDFISMIEMPRSPQQAVRALATASPMQIDYGVLKWEENNETHEEPFFNQVGIGFDASVSIVAPRYKHLPGISGYLYSVFRVLRHWKGPQVTIHCISDAGDRSCLYAGALLLATVGNGRRSGGMFLLTPDAKFADGLFDICIVENATALRIIQVIPRAIVGRHTTAREVHMYQARLLEIASEDGLPIHADGENLAENAKNITLEVISRGLSVMMPT